MLLSKQIASKISSAIVPVFEMDSSARNEDGVISDSPSCRCQTRKTFVHLQNTNQGIFDEILRSLWTSTDGKDPYTIKAQKRSKEIVQIIHVASVFQPSFYEAMRILFVRKEIKNNDFIQQFRVTL